MEKQRSFEIVPVRVGDQCEQMLFFTINSRRNVRATEKQDGIRLLEQFPEICGTIVFTENILKVEFLVNFAEPLILYLVACKVFFGGRIIVNFLRIINSQ